MMHWDLIPAWYMKGKGLSVEEVIKRKNAKKDGFSSFNARIETVQEKATYKNAWAKHQRCFFPATHFYERPNRKDRPADFPSREYEIPVATGKFLAGLYDVWTSDDGETLNSCTMLTESGMGVSVMDEIWHDRIPHHVDDKWG